MAENDVPSWDDLPTDSNAPSWDDLPAEGETPKGPIAKGFDEYAKGSNSLGDKISQGFNDLKREVAPLFKGLEPLKEPAKDVGRAIGTGMDVLNRVAGTAFSAVADPFIDPTASSEVFDFKSYAMADRENGPSEYPILDKYFPVGLGEHVGYPIGSSIFKNIAEAIKSIGGETAEDTAYVIDAFAPGAGMASSLIASTIMPLPKVGGLTKAGRAAEKIGKLESGVARQFYTGQRGIGGEFGGAFGFPSKEIILKSKSAGRLVDKVNQAVTKAELADIRMNPLRAGRKLMTKSPSPLVNLAVEDMNMALNGVYKYQDDFVKGSYLKSSAMGVDLVDDANRARFYNAIETPGTSKMSGKDRAVFNYLDGNLRQEVAKTRAAGVPVVEKAFKVDIKGGAAIDKPNLAQKYVPRNASLDKTQKLMASKTVKRMEDSEKLVNALTDTQYGGKKMGSFQRKRSIMTRNGMNEYMKERYDIDDFFHDDVVLAYGEKIADLQRARIQKEFADKIIGAFGKNADEYSQIVEEAANKVRTQRATGIVPTSDDVFMASLQNRMFDSKDGGAFVRYKDLPVPVKNRLTAIGALSGDAKDFKNMKLPEEIADYISDVMYKPNLNEWAEGFLAYQNAMKGFMFANPGYHGRNMVESYGRAMSLGAGTTEHILATAAMTRNKGAFAKYYDEFKELNSGLTLASALDDPTKLVRGKLLVPKSYAQADNAQKLLFRSFKEIGSKGRWKEFLTDLRAGKKNIRDNPLFKFSTEFGNAGENMSRFAVFGTLRQEGYKATEAMRKLNRVFPDYQITREGLRKTQLAAPFANYFIKNAETTLKLLAENPRGLALMGPQGALQRSLENWAGFDPERTYKFKELHGGWARDTVYTSIMPSADYLEQNPDLVKELLSKFNSQLIPGDVIWSRLPSNYHALSQLDPRKMHENFGPLIVGLYAATGVDPFTGKELITENTGDENIGRAKAFLKEMTGPIVPHAMIPVLQKGMETMFGQYTDSLLKMGLPEQMITGIMGSKAEKAQKKAKKAMTKLKTLWMGGATELDMQAFIQVDVRLKAESRLLNSLLIDEDATKKNIDNAVDGYVESMDAVVQIIDTAFEYNSVISENGGEQQPEIDFALDQVMENPPAEQPVLDEAVEGGWEDLEDLEDMDREPQSVEGGLTPTQIPQQDMDPNPRGWENLDDIKGALDMPLDMGSEYNLATPEGNLKREFDIEDRVMENIVEQNPNATLEELIEKIKEAENYRKWQKNDSLQIDRYDPSRMPASDDNNIAQQESILGKEPIGSTDNNYEKYLRRLGLSDELIKQELAKVSESSSKKEATKEDVQDIADEIQKMTFKERDLIFSTIDPKTNRPINMATPEGTKAAQRLFEGFYEQKIKEIYPNASPEFMKDILIEVLKRSGDLEKGANAGTREVADSDWVDLESIGREPASDNSSKGE